MDMDCSTFDYVVWQGDSATHPLAFMPFRVRQIMRLPLSLVVAGMSLLPTRRGQAVAVKPLKRQQRRSPLFAASARPDAPSGASNCGF